MAPLPFRKQVSSSTPNGRTGDGAAATSTTPGSSSASTPPTSFHAASASTSSSSSSSTANGLFFNSSLDHPSMSTSSSTTAGGTLGASGSSSTDSPNRAFSRLLRRRPSVNNRNLPPTDEALVNKDDPSSATPIPPPHLPSSASSSHSGLFTKYRPGSSGSVKQAMVVSSDIGSDSTSFDTSPAGHRGGGGHIRGHSPATTTTMTTKRSNRSQRTDHPFFIAGSHTHTLDDDDTDLTPAPIFHHSSGLSPTRRAMPRSPRAPKSSSGERGPHASTPLSLQPLRISSHGSTSESSPTTTSSSYSASQTSPRPPRPTVTAEWLSRKPVSGRAKLEGQLEGAAHIRSLSGGGTSSTKATIFNGAGTGSRLDRTISPSSSASRTSAGADAASTSGVDSEDGQVGIKSSRRRSHITSTRDGSGGFQVEVFCVDNRGENDELKWEVTIRRRPQIPVEGEPGRSTDDLDTINNIPILAPTSPLNLSTTQSVAQAPSSASSINLSLSLDQPTGKLVFIAFPMDLHATPKRRHSKRTNGLSSRSPKVTSPRPLTPPLHAGPRSPTYRTTTPPPVPVFERPASSIVTPPPAPNPNDASPPRTPPQPHHKRISQNSLWPSPSRSGRRSPILNQSPSVIRTPEVWTPRRSRMLNARELGGGLYAKGTVDGMSEELESS
ncbi:hypothetical protein BD324DRAFT_682269 [Kockovaella imperatae]|uniref:Uncharacterized protein n=1 Tax=Kockovaella imperatae TaxID=4999 RepID=A0A1Y1UF25_9TREE|nr:hypothetical protein BD324DRAFT_682269 [Kockovaella imperatae]ORX36137.1 hypothetical protein BD324DRAFT_682269 [Kockovaella imperatae]